MCRMDIHISLILLTTLIHFSTENPLKFIYETSKCISPTCFHVKDGKVTFVSENIYFIVRPSANNSQLRNTNYSVMNHKQTFLCKVLAIPGQIFNTNLIEKVENVTETAIKDIFSIISEANKDTTKMIHEGDIVVPIGRSAIKCDDNSCRWRKTNSGIVTVPYTISSAFDASSLPIIAGAMQDFETLTCVRFIPRSGEPDYLQIISDIGCWSYVGKTGGPQEVSLQVPVCLSKGTIQHELNHALGFYHEQSRSDRDAYVDIQYDNILPKAVSNFDKYDTNNLGLEYDYLSVMHYGRTAFSKQDGIVTIVPKPNPAVTIGQRYGLSNLDISKINRLYQCGTCSTLLPDSTGTLMSANYPNNYPNNASCVWLIRASSNKVFIQFNAFDVQASPNCSSDYLKVYDGANRSSPVLLDRACGTGQLPSFVASSNTMLLELVSDKTIAATGFKASYTTVKCGSTFTNPSGVISTPSYPSNYPPLMDCTWIITAPAGFVISLNMADFHIEQQRTCAYDYVLIFNGPKLTSPEIGRYCGSSAIPSIVSSGNSLLLQFHSDDSVQTKGFIAKYAFVPQK